MFDRPVECLIGNLWQVVNAFNDGLFLRKGPGAEEAELRVIELGYDLSGRSWNEECQDFRRAIWRR